MILLFRARSCSSAYYFSAALQEIRAKKAMTTRRAAYHQAVTRAAIRSPLDTAWV